MYKGAKSKPEQFVLQIYIVQICRVINTKVFDILKKVIFGIYDNAQEFLGFFQKGKF